MPGPAQPGHEVATRCREVLLEHGDDLGRQPWPDQRGAVQQRAGQAGVRGHVGQGAPAVRGAAVGVDGTEVAQGAPCRVEGRGRGRIEEREPRGVGRAPHREVQREPGQVGDRDLRGRVGGEVGVVGLAPAAVRRTRAQPARATGSLVGGRPADPDGDEAAEAAPRVVPRLPRKPGVDDDPHPRDRQRGLCDRGGDHDPAAGTLAQRVVLGRGVEPTVQGQHVHAGSHQRTADPVDLAGAGDEDQDVALPLGERAPDGGGHVGQERRGDTPVVHRQHPGRRARPAGRHRVQRPGHVDDRGTPEQGREPLRLHRGRHRDQREVLTQRPAHVEQQREQQVGVQGPLVHLVEHDG